MSKIVMEKAYDIKVLGEELKSLGLPVLEDTAVKIVEKIFKWLEESAKISHTPYDDLVALLYPQIKILILAQVDKIDPNN